MSTSFPSYVKIDDKSPLMLKKGMVIWAGNDTTQFIEVMEVSHDPKSTVMDCGT
jgi:hypothetical protein